MTLPPTPYHLYSTLEFLSEQFPPADDTLDSYSGKGIGDVIFEPPSQPGTVCVFIIPFETASNWQAQARAPINLESLWMVCPADSLLLETLDELLDQVGPSGVLLDVAVLIPEHREELRRTINTD